MLSCGKSPDSSSNVSAGYDKSTGKLVQLTINQQKDGKPNIVSYMDGPKFVRIEIDKDENGSIDRWEYFKADRTLEKVGISRLNDGIADMWLFEGADGVPAKVEMSTKRNGTVDRTEFYEKGELARAEQDTDSDGRVDKWETYAGGSLAKVSFDTTKSGKPTVTIDYQQEKR